MITKTFEIYKNRSQSNHTINNLFPELLHYMGVFNSKQHNNVSTKSRSTKSTKELPEYPHLKISNFPKHEGETITLKDGRLLGFKEYKFQHITQHPITNGLNKEHVILLIPGLPGTRFFCHPQVLSSMEYQQQKNQK